MDLSLILSTFEFSRVTAKKDMYIQMQAAKKNDRGYEMVNGLSNILMGISKDIMPNKNMPPDRSFVFVRRSIPSRMWNQYLAYC